MKAETSEEKGEKDKKYYRKAKASFSYRISVPGKIDFKKEPEAAFSHGVMKIIFSKLEESIPKKIISCCCQVLG